MSKRILFIKSSIPPNAHWITVHGTPGAKGQPVLIEPQPDGSAKVIGGAGGALNHLRLRNVKSHSDYKQEAAAKAQEKREKRKAQIEEDKQSGVHQAKQQARKDIQEKKRSAERQVIDAVAKKAGWTDDELHPEPPEHLSEKAKAKFEAKHHSRLLKKAKEFIKQAREKLVNDPSARADAGIGEVPLYSDNPSDVSVDDLDPVPNKTPGLGFNPDYKGRAEASGLNAEELHHEATQVKLSAMTPEQRQAAMERGEGGNLINEELQGIQEPPAPKADASLLSAKEALDMVKLGKHLADIEKQAREATSNVDNSPAEPKAFVLEAKEDAELDQAAKDAVINDLRTAQTVAFLSEVGSIAGGDPTETLGGHIGVGAFNSINALALAIGGDALVDRSVVDVLGIAGAAQVLARRLHNDMPDDADNITQAVEDWHVNHYMQTSADSIKKARELTKAAKEIEVNAEGNGHDLSVAQELNARRRACIGDAQRILGQALGEMEAGAALTMAMKQGAADKLEVSLGKTSPETAIKQVRAIGLLPGDYELEKVAGDTFLTVNAEGMDRLAKPVSRDDVQQVRRNLAIIRGDMDEDGWLPLGVANRPDLVMDVKPGVAERIAQPFKPGDNLEQSISDYIGGRTADGDAPADILADLQSVDFIHKAGDADAYFKALNTVAPLKDENGKMHRIESLADKFDKMADDYVEKLGGNRSTLNKQKFELNDKAMEALHRALAETPEGVAAYKQIGDLGHKDQRALRNFFHANVARESEDAADMRQKLEKLQQDEPERMTEDLLGETSENPSWRDWRTQKDELTEKLNASSLTWDKYVKMLGGNAKAYEAIQDMVRSKVSKSFVDAHNKLNPDSPLKLGKSVIRNNLDHLDAVDPSAMAARLEKHRALVDSLRERVGGKYSSGSVSDKIQAAKEKEAAYEQSQMGLFSSEDVPDAGAGNEPAALGADERHTLGHEAERQIAGIMGVVGNNFKPGQPTQLRKISMSGQYMPQQRMVKYITANKRMVGAAGAGSGKTNVMLATHSHLSGLGKVKRSVFLVPSIVQGQFSGEALRLLEPGKFKAHIQPGASRDERIAAYKDPDTHICVMTHQSFRDDMVHLGAKHAGISEADMTEKLQGMTPMERKDWVAGVMKQEGINFDASFIDEAHDTLNRAGKENSSLANVTEALGHHTEYHGYFSGDPVKNDASEIHSMLQKMDPERYADRAEFMRRYGSDTIASKEALKREMARYVFPTSITPDVAVDRKTEQVPLSDGQKQALSELEKNLSRARLAHRAGKVDIEAAKAISPSSFEGVPESDHEQIAEALQKSVGILKSSAINRIINSHPDNAKVNHAVKLVQERGNKQGVIFARNRESIDQYKKAMEAIGKRVVTITGSDSAADKDKKRRMFTPEKGEPEADILIASDAGAVGMNLQSGQYLIQHDVSMTAKTHSQRNARIHRIGQQKGIELIDLVADHKEDKRARDRLMKKYDLKNMMADPIDGLDDSGVGYFLKQKLSGDK